MSVYQKEIPSNRSHTHTHTHSHSIPLRFLLSPFEPPFNHPFVVVQGSKCTALAIKGKKKSSKQVAREEDRKERYGMLVVGWHVVGMLSV